MDKGGRRLKTRLSSNRHPQDQFGAACAVDSGDIGQPTEIAAEFRKHGCRRSGNRPNRQQLWDSQARASTSRAAGGLDWDGSEVFPPSALAKRPEAAFLPSHPRVRPGIVNALLTTGTRRVRKGSSADG